MGVQWRAITWLAAVACAVGASAAGAQIPGYQFNVRKVADTSTPVPGGVGTFTGFTGAPTSDGFVGTFAGGSGAYGIGYTYSGGVVTATPYKIADTSTPIPGGTGTFTSFGPPAEDVFRALGADGQQGIYRAPAIVGRPLSLIADRNTPAPGGGGTFASFGNLPTGQGAGASLFYAQTSSGVQGVYQQAAQIVTIADTNTPVPRHAGTTFDSFAGFVGRDTFRGHAGSKFGVYTFGPNGVQVVMDDTAPVIDRQSHTPIETFGGTIDAFSRDGAAFIGRESSVIESIMQIPRWYFGRGPGAVKLVSILTPTPDGKTFYDDFIAVSHAGGSIEDGPLTAFLARCGDDTTGIYVQEGDLGRIERLISTGMTLDGKVVTSLDMGSGATDGEALTFLVDFADGSSGIYSASVATPEPMGAVVGGVLLAGAAGFGRRRTRHRRRRTTAGAVTVRR